MGFFAPKRKGAFEPERKVVKRRRKRRQRARQAKPQPVSPTAPDPDDPDAAPGDRKPDPVDEITRAVYKLRGLMQDAQRQITIAAKSANLPALSRAQRDIEGALVEREQGIEPSGRTRR